MAYVGPAQRRQGVYCHEHWTPVGYPLLSSNYAYMVRDVFVEGRLTETYQAKTNVEREVSYIFEVPPEASVVGFSAQVGNTRVEGIVDEKTEADKKYRQAKSAGVQAWKLDKVNDEVFQISLGNVSPNSSIIISVTYVYVISTDTLEDSVRLTIPAGLAARPGAGPASQTTVPTAPTGRNAVTITVGIEVDQNVGIFDLNSLSHHANITNGFSDNSFKNMTPVEKMRAFKQWKSYVEFSSDQFLRNHFVLVWNVPWIDQPRCIVEPLSPAIPGKPQTIAFALTLVSNIWLELEEHEYIFVVDNSGSMSGSRTQTANAVVGAMLRQLPTAKRSSFNIYNFTTSAWSIIPGGRSLGYDKNNVSTALRQLKTNASGGTNINAALTTVLNQRDHSKPRCSIIVVTDGLDWGVTSAMQTVQRNATAAAAQSKLLRVFVMGLGDDVSRGMCEALARAGSGATAYISESQLQEHDHLVSKAETLINVINRAPIRVRSIDWGMNPAPAQPGASGDNLPARPKPNQGQLGAAAKGDNLPPPKAIQQAPLPGTMFWAVRSYWYAIVNGTPRAAKARIVYDIPGSGLPTKTIDVNFGLSASGRLIHSLAARALIQTFEEKATSITDSTEKYWNECEIVRLGKTYNLASTQTSFVATMNGVGTRTYVASNAPPAGPSLLSGVPKDHISGLGFVGTQTLAAPTVQARFAAPASATTASDQSLMAGLDASAAPTMDLTARYAVPDASSAAASAPSVGGDDLSEIIGAQDGNGAFDSSTVERIVFPGTGIPAVPAFISSLEGRDNVKEQIWLAICVIAFFQKKHSGRSSEWATSKSKAEKFVKTTLCCIFGVDPSQSEGIFTNSLDDAEGYFY
ncbi:hypothetical protein MFIFM68171_03046 [Madurella fahalii]|uniref:Uncharacterized protein n=1 Tax=Madurella fahalii TaxID=1157608 RepID=A0ABQ0G509_9PEZI